MLSRVAEWLFRTARCAFQPWPGSYLTWKDRRLLILKAQATRPLDTQAAGRVFLMDGMPAVGTSDGALVLLEIQPSGKGSMEGAAFIRGAPGFIGADLTHEN